MKNQINWRQIWQHKIQSPIEGMFLRGFKDFGLEPMIQYPLDVFYIDFAFPEIKLAIEIDGIKYHSAKKDAYKNKRIKELGWKLERFGGWFVFRHIGAAVGKISLQYFSDKLNDDQKNLALSGIATYFAKVNLPIADGLIKLRIKNHN